jgi:glycosyltransferase involved in cell wall biosynthesis
MTESLRDNSAWAGTTEPRLSVLIPFMRDDPRPLLEALGRERPQDVEIVLLDDGGGDDAMAETVAACIDSLPIPARLVRLDQNEGRARGRNRLAAHARAAHLLFLDADMLPDSPGFLRTYLDLVRQENPPVVFGGFSMLQASRDRAYALHRAMAQRSDCLPAATRARTPEKYIYTSNLLIRRDVFAAEAFDETFTGWGWEDVEWGVRISRRWPIRHLDNPATHLGLDTAGGLVAKYRQSVANFARIVANHPDVVGGYPSVRAARLLRRIPFLALWRPLLAIAARMDWAPVAGGGGGGA